ncbi:MAG: DUF998 domain-containing protein [Pseudonocardia sp.]|nr:DUF998 domain-containing protein [Pseudonocardia sp.]
MFNTGVIMHGVIFLIAVILLRALFTGRATRRALLALASVHGVGMVLLGVFHGSQQSVENGNIVFHGAGAMSAILGGLGAFAIAGIAVLRRRTSLSTGDSRRWLGWVLITFSVIGVAGFGYLLVTAGSDYDSIPERIAVYAIAAAELVIATAVLLPMPSTRRRPIWNSSSPARMCSPSPPTTRTTTLPPESSQTPSTGSGVWTSSSTTRRSSAPASSCRTSPRTT